MTAIDEAREWLAKQDDATGVISVGLVRELLLRQNVLSNQHEAPVGNRASLSDVEQSERDKEIRSHPSETGKHDMALQQLTEDAEDMGAYGAPRQATREELVEALRTTLARAVDRGELDDEVRDRIRNILSREEV